VAHRFTPTAFLIWSGLLIWMGNFLFAYSFAALACARRFAETEILGFAVVPLVSTASSILSGLAIVAVMWTRVRRLREEASADANSRFISFVTLGVGGLALLALVWIALPPLLANARC
jgi:hypothetical protein